jgi:hypothetical protein
VVIAGVAVSAPATAKTARREAGTAESEGRRPEGPPLKEKRKQFESMMLHEFGN